jgi:hypothetical protein
MLRVFRVFLRSIHAGQTQNRFQLRICCVGFALSTFRHHTAIPDFELYEQLLVQTGKWMQESEKHV